MRIARDQIAESGADAMSFVSLARLAAVSRPAPYRHFADRKALLEAVTTEGSRGLPLRRPQPGSDLALLCFC